MNGSFKKQPQCQTEPQFAQVVYAEKESISQDFFFLSKSISQDLDSSLGLQWVKKAEQETEVPEHQLK